MYALQTEGKSDVGNAIMAQWPSLSKGLRMDLLLSHLTVPEERNIKAVIVWAGRHKTWASAVPCWWTLRLKCHRCEHWLFRGDPKHGSTVSSSHILDWGPFRGQRLPVKWFFCTHWSLSYFLLSFHCMAWLKSVFILLRLLILQTLPFCNILLSSA